MPIFSLALHPAADGDALILTWGERGAPHHALVDLGRRRTYSSLKPLLARIGHFELLTLTHIDADHIEGAVPLFEERTFPLTAGQIWFNAHDQLVAALERLPDPPAMTLSVPQAEKITAGLVRHGLRTNAAFADGIVSVDGAEDASPIALPGGLTVTLLSPTDRKLVDLLPDWNAELEVAALRVGDGEAQEMATLARRRPEGPIVVEELAAVKSAPDDTRANGASIAFVAEFAGKRVLMGADAHPDVLAASLVRLGASPSTRYRLDCFKLPHHASKANVTRDLLDLVDCTCFAVSTDGSRHSHPDREAIARILATEDPRRKRLVFNSRQENTAVWDDAELMKRWNYDCVFPADDREGVVIDI